MIQMLENVYIDESSLEVVDIAYSKRRLPSIEKGW